MARLRRISGGGLLALALALTALGLAFGAPGRGEEPHLRLAAAGGSLSLANSKDGQAVFTAAGMRPGGQVSGTVQIANTGSLPGALAVARTAANEVAGAGGGLLSTRLALQVVDVTDASAPVEVWSGKLAAMPRLGVGVLPAGEQRAYRFTATMPAGAGDNAFQGAQLSVGLLWTAVASEPAPTATPTATPAAPPPAVTEPPVAPPVTPAATGAALAAELFPLPAARRCVSGRRLAIKVRRPRDAGFASITVKVNRKTKVRLKGEKARNVKSRLKLRRLPAGRLKVSVAAVLTDGRQAAATRVYRTCAKKRR